MHQIFDEVRYGAKRIFLFAWATNVRARNNHFGRKYAILEGTVGEALRQNVAKFFEGKDPSPSSCLLV